MKIKNIIYFAIFLLSIYSCVEEIDLVTESGFESALVIEATITNELKPQMVKLSRTYPLEIDGPMPESGATVKLLLSGAEYNFQESEPGIYVSTSTFAAQHNIDYKLNVQTNDGKQYSSSTAQLTQETQIDNLYFERGFNENGEEGVLVFLDSYNPIGNTKFYRYTYEETYKIIAPRYSGLDLTGCSPSSLQIKEEQQQICYNTVNSNAIILENTNIFEEDRVDGLRIRFLNRNNYIISHRYSILVKQHVQSEEAHKFYKSLKELSETESVFSQIQPGFLEGNVFSNVNELEKVIGFFEVSSVDSRRIYFNYEDLFPGEILPPFIINCVLFAPECGLLLDHLSRGYKYYAENSSPVEGEGPFFIVAPPCGDCTVLGNNVPPDFWIE